jgi:hypothetical protein
MFNWVPPEGLKLCGGQKSFVKVRRGLKWCARGMEGTGSESRIRGATPKITAKGRKCEQRWGLLERLDIFEFVARIQVGSYKSHGVANCASCGMWCSQDA